MADYYSLLSQALANLPASTPETRRALYTRARELLLQHLQAADPPLSPQRIAEEAAAFDAAVARLEVELAVAAACDTSPPISEPAAAEDDDPRAPPAQAPIVTSVSDTADETPAPKPVEADSLGAHIFNNSLKSVLLILGFPFVLPFVVFCVLFFPLVLLGSAEAYVAARTTALILFVACLGISLVWLPIAYLINQWIIDRSTGAHLLTRSDDLRVWNLLEMLSTRAGIAMPQLRVIETGELNAYASGLSQASYSVTVTKGLMATLNDAELSGVLGHELTHIRNRDVRLTVIAQILVGLVPIIETIFVRGVFWITHGLAKLYEVIFTVIRLPGAVLMIKFAYGLTFLIGKAFAFVVGSVSFFVSLLLNFCLSRRREFMADAGAVELTGDADAMISALRKISGHSDVPTALANVREMMFDNPRLAGFEGFFATHPTIQARIDALLPHVRNRSAGAAPLLPDAIGNWSDKVADILGIGLLLAAMVTIILLILVAPSGTSRSEATPFASRQSYFAQPVQPAPRYSRAATTPPFRSASRRNAFVVHPARAHVSLVRPSFDCRRATYADEKQICTLPTLARLDRLTTQAYNEARAIPGNHRAALTAARSFLAARRGCGASIDCIVHQQLAVLNVYRSLGATVPDPR